MCIRASEGAVRVDGHDVRSLKAEWLKSNMGIVPQESILFGTSLRENIGYGRPGATEEEIIEAAKAANAHDFILGLPEGYETLAGERGAKLSGGQKQRIAIARTLLKNPSILILDHSTSTVDTETEAEIRDALQNLMIGRTTFVIAHRIQSIMDADLILVMDKGRICQMGKHEDLMQQDGIYKQIFFIQTSIQDELEKEIASVS